MLSDVESKFVFAGGQTWYRVVGDITKTSLPLVVLHGGPGYPSYYLENLAALATAQRPVIFYDQFTCGRSTGPLDPELWTLDLFVEQFYALLDHLGLGKVDVLGQSWGGQLVLEIATRSTERLRRIILASTLCDSMLFLEGAERLLHTMPDKLVKTIELHEANQDFSHPDFVAAYARFQALFVDRIEPKPESIDRSDREMNRTLYEHLWGPTEFRCTGILRDWSVTDKLETIDIPTLITSGRYDEAVPEMQELMVSKIPDATWVLFEQSAHQSHLSEEKLYLEIAAKFLNN